MELIALIIEAIPTVGFPIVVVIALGVFIYQIYKKSEKREDALMQEIRESRMVNAEAIDTIAKYAEKLEAIQTDINEIKSDVVRITEHII